jgi:hypothetical protein
MDVEAENGGVALAELSWRLGLLQIDGEVGAVPQLDEMG